MSVAYLVVLAAAQAQSDLSTRETRLLVDRYGECVVARQARRASEAILANVDNSMLMKRYPQLIDGQCMRPARGQVIGVRFQGDQYRYALADALVSKELGAFPPPSLDAVPRLDHREPTPPSRTDRRGRPLKEKAWQEAQRRHEAAEAFTYLSRYGECVVRVDPAAARALLLTEPETPQESVRFAAMRTALATCLPEGRTLAFGKLALRGTIAVNYYRLAMAARTQVAGRTL